MESHLANHCTKAPASVVREYLQKLGGEDSETAKKKRKTIGPQRVKFSVPPTLPRSFVKSTNNIFFYLYYSF